MSLSALTCPHCVGSFLVDSSMAGQEALCPNCKGMVLIPPVEAAPPPVSANEATTQFACPVCFQAFAALSSMAGQRVLCPHCGSMVMVPQGLEAEFPGVVGPPVSTSATGNPRPGAAPSPPLFEPPLPPVHSQPSGPTTKPPSMPLPERPGRPAAVVEHAWPPQPPSPSHPSPSHSSPSKPATGNPPVIAPSPAHREQPPAAGDAVRAVEPAAPPVPTDTDRPIRKLSPEERARYRLIKNAVVLAICAVVLGALFLVLRYVPILKELSQRVEFIYDSGLMI